MDWMCLQQHLSGKEVKYLEAENAGLACII